MCTSGSVGTVSTWTGVQNLINNSQGKIVGDKVLVGTLSVAGTCENRVKVSPNCEHSISHECTPARRNVYITSCLPVNEMGRIIGETEMAAIIKYLEPVPARRTKKTHERHVRCNVLNTVSARNALTRRGTR